MPRPVGGVIHYVTNYFGLKSSILIMVADLLTSALQTAQSNDNQLLQILLRRKCAMHYKVVAPFRIRRSDLQSKALYGCQWATKVDTAFRR